MSFFDLMPILEKMLAVADNISDLNFSVGRPPQVEINGKLTPVEIKGMRNLTPYQTEIIAMSLVEGNTDAQGNPQANMTLSERRALAVKNYIVKNFPNIPPTRFQTIGRGQSNPVAENTTEAGRQQNRRTDIKVILATQ